MSFGGGGGGAITAHVHDNTPSEGGPLDFGNVTIGSMAQGSVTYSDGAALQELVAPALPAGEVLSFQPAATAPSWSAAAAGGSYQFIEQFTLGADAQYFDCTLTNPYVYDDYSSLVLQLSLQASVTTNGQALCCRYANSGTSYYTTNYMDIMSYLSDATGVVKQYYSANPCIVLQPDMGTVGNGVNDNQWITSNLAFYNSGSSGTHKNKPFKNWTINTNEPSGNEGFGFHEDATNRTELTSFRFAFCQDDFSFPVGTFEVQADSTVTVWRVANS